VRTAFINELLALAEQDSRIWLVTGDLGFSVLEPFAERFPNRYLNAGVAEQNMVGVASGLARSGASVFVYSIANFPTFRCLEQIRNDVCYPGANVTIVSVGSGFSYGSHGSTHHAIEDLAVMRSLPNIVVVSPGDPTEARLATRAVARLGRPAYLRLGKAGEAVVNSTTGEEFALGTMRCVREGSDVTVMATGSVLVMAVAAADALERDGLSVRVYSAHTLKPFDGETLVRALSETAGVVTVEEHRLIGGLRSAVGEALLDVPIRPAGRIMALGIAPDAIVGTGDQAHLRAASGLGADSIADAARALLAGRSGG
jgi:transketolase